MKMKNYLWATLCMALFCPRTGAQTIDVQSDTWVCNDGLNRVVASSDRGVTRTKIDSTAQVGIFYYIWHGQHGAEVKDITRLLEKDPDNPTWGGEGQFHWGGKPALGYYAGGDKFIVAKHMQMLVDAGVDFYFFDVTNAFDPDFHTESLLRELNCSRSLLEMRFRATQGRSIRDEIQLLRFDKALSLLRKPNQAIAPIANLCGYASEPFFKRLFKKKTGLTMREWRRQNATSRA